MVRNHTKLSIHALKCPPIIFRTSGAILNDKKITSVREIFETDYNLSPIEESIFSLTSRDREHLLLWIMRRNCAQA